MSRRILPEELVQKSLAEHVRLGQVIASILIRANDKCKADVADLPDGARRHRKAELQGFPAWMRVRIHQIIEGTHKDRAVGGEPILVPKHIRNAAVCLVVEGRESRILKHNNLHPVQRTGRYQGALVEQRRYWDWVRDPGLFPDAPPLLHGLFHYVLDGFDIVGLEARIPDGFENGFARYAISEPIDLQPFFSREDEGVFLVQTVSSSVLGEEGENLIVSNTDVSPEDIIDPFAEGEGLGSEGEERTVDPDEAVMEEEATKPADEAKVLDPDEAPKSDD